MKNLTLCILNIFALFWMTAICGNTLKEKSPPILTSADIPGFFLHHSIVLDALNFPSTTLHYVESWMTVPKKDFDYRVRHGGTAKKVPYQYISVHRYVFSTTNEARHYVEDGWSPNAKANSLDRSRWKPNSPSGRRIGSQSWYAVYELPTNPSEAEIAAARKINEDTLRMLIVVNSTVITLTVEGSSERPVNRTWAERIARVTAANVCRHSRDEADHDDDDEHHHGHAGSRHR